MPTAVMSTRSGRRVSPTIASVIGMVATEVPPVFSPYCCDSRSAVADSSSRSCGSVVPGFSRATTPKKPDDRERPIWSGPK
jgi:hypothetical protein